MRYTVVSITEPSLETYNPCYHSEYPDPGVGNIPDISLQCFIDAQLIQGHGPELVGNLLDLLQRIVDYIP
jgi:hypothetical protein